MICRECGAGVSEGAAFCQQCGARIGESADSAAEPADPNTRLRKATAHRQGETEPEEELWQGSYSKWAMCGAWIVAAVVTIALLIAGAIAAADGMAWAAIAGVILLMWLALYAWLLYRQFSVRYYLTNQRFVHERGLLWRTIDRIELIDVDDVTFRQGPIERLLGIGTVQISSSDRTHPELALPGIDRVRDVAGRIDDLRRQERMKRGLHIEAV